MTGRVLRRVLAVLRKGWARVLPLRASVIPPSSLSAAVAVDRCTSVLLTAIVVHVNNVCEGRDGKSRQPRLFAACGPAKESGIMPSKPRTACFMGGLRNEP
jgi:hypothetical protein